MVALLLNFSDNGTKSLCPKDRGCVFWCDSKLSVDRVFFHSGTPPPPYEAVARDIDKEEAAIAAGLDRSRLTFAPLSNEPSTRRSSSTSGGTMTNTAQAATTATIGEENI